MNVDPEPSLQSTSEKRSKENEVIADEKKVWCPTRNQKLL